MYTSTVTSKGQATIPAPIRKKLGIKPGQKIVFKDSGKDIQIKASVKPADLMGILKTNIKYNKVKARKAVGKMLGERYERTLR